MLDDHVRNIMESKSIERLNGFPLDEVKKALGKLPNVTHDFFTSLDVRYRVVKSEDTKYLEFGAQLNNTLVTPPPGLLKRLNNRRNPPDPEDYNGLVENLDKRTRVVLFGSKRLFRASIPTSYSVVGTITEIGRDLDDGSLRKRTPFLLVPHEISPEIGSPSFELMRPGSNDWSKIDKSRYNQVMESSNTPSGLGYIS